MRLPLSQLSSAQRAAERERDCIDKAHKSNIKALHRRHADQSHHEQKYMAPTSVVQQAQESREQHYRPISQALWVVAGKNGRTSLGAWILLGFVQNIQRNATEIVLIIASSVTA